MAKAITKKQSKNNRLRHGFTIVELLIVIVIIGILAAIVVVAYRGITSNAAAAVLKSDIKEAAGQLNLAKASSGSYPADTSNLSKSEGTVYQYTLASGDYCLSATSEKAGATAYHISSMTVGGAVEDGVCVGHTLPTPPPNPGYVNVAWTQRTGVGICCSSVALSSDGTKLAGIADDSFFYSSDSGSTWSSTTPFANYTHNIASSADGSKLFVTTAYYTDTPIYVSTNSGVSWSTPASAYQMSHITASSDGSKIATGNYDAIIVSTDTGSSWTDMNTGSDYPNGDYMAVDMSDNSSVLLASSGSSSPNYLYVSNNMGSNWTKLSSGPTSVFGSDDIAVSGNGNIFYVISRPDSGSNDNFVYKSSNNGASWSQLTIPGANLPLVAVNTSNDGSVVVAASNNGYVYTSSNGGASWTENSSIGSRYWTDVAVSSDGSKIVAVADGIVYTGVYGP